MSSYEIIVYLKLFDVFYLIASRSSTCSDNIIIMVITIAKTNDNASSKGESEWNGDISSRFKGTSVR